MDEHTKEDAKNCFELSYYQKFVLDVLLQFEPSIEKIVLGLDKIVYY